MTSHVIAYRSSELLFGMHTFNFNCFFDDFNCVFTQIRCLSRLLPDPILSCICMLNSILILVNFGPENPAFILPQKKKQYKANTLKAQFSYFVHLVMLCTYE